MKELHGDWVGVKRGVMSRVAIEPKAHVAPREDVFLGGRHGNADVGTGTTWTFFAAGSFERTRKLAL